MWKGLSAKAANLSLRGDLAVVAGLALVFGFLLARRGLVLGDEGYILQQSLEVARGTVLYRDLDSFVAPGVWLLHAALFQFVEPSVLASRMLAVGCFTATTVFVYAIARRTASRATGWLAVAALAVFALWSFPAWTFSFYSPYSIAFVLVGLDRFLAFNETRKTRDLFFCGVMLSVAIVFKQNYGIFAVAGIFVALFAARLSAQPGRERAAGRLVADLATLALGAVAVAAPLLLYFALNGALADLLDSLILRPFEFAIQHEIAYPSLWSVGSPIWGNFVDWLTYGSALVSITGAPSWPKPAFALLGSFHMLLYWLPPLLFVLATIEILKRRKRDGSLDLPLLAVFSVTGFVYLGVFPRADFNHLVNVYQPIVVLGAVVAHRLYPRLEALPLRRKLFIKSGLGVVAAGYVLFALVGFLNLMTRMTDPVQGARGGVLVSPLDVGELAYQVSWIRANSAPTEPVLTIPDLAMLNFLSERPLPGAHYNMYQVHIGADGGAGVVRATEEERVRIAVSRFHNFFSNKVGFLDYAPELANYLGRTFQAEEIVGNNRALLMRRRARPLPVMSLVDVLEDCDVDPEEVLDRHRIEDHVLFRTLFQNIGDGRYEEAYTVTTRCRVWVPDGATLAFSVTYPSPVRVRTGTTVGMELNVVDADESTNLFEHRLFVFPADGWAKPAARTIRVDLGDYANREVTLEFQTSLNGRVWLHPWFGGGFSLDWQGPRIEYPPLAVEEVRETLD